MTAPQPFVFSIRPKYTAKILDGSKVWEFRTRRPSLESGDLILVYETAPRSRIVCSARVRSVLAGSPVWVWNNTIQHGIGLHEYQQYFKGRKRAVGISLADVLPLDLPLPEGMAPPQSWSRYKGVWS